MPLPKFKQNNNVQDVKVNLPLLLFLCYSLPSPEAVNITILGHTFQNVQWNIKNLCALILKQMAAYYSCWSANC